ncbi:PE family protein [Mycobacterium sp. TY814]|uniref:PE family protein n=1 Tax=unclassified Mycobacterium TaxID=2642494 RepID=UPI00274053F2|nr:PE family protein [Mycobacterium sp. TY814]MDP7723171.1 PE family protein [Mycobacterium sp. TY814]
MSFVMAAPQQVQAAARDLAGIRSILAEASASAATPTSAVVPAAADEVSAAIASLFADFGEEFQIISAQTQVFHAEFVNALNAAAGAYLSTEIANAESALSPLSGSTGLPAAAGGFGGAYQTLYANTVANLQTLNTVWSANPAPLLRQFVTNQMAYAHTIAADVQYVVQNFPAVLADLPANVRAAIQTFLAFNPAPYIQQFISNQVAYAQIIGTSLQNGATDFVAGLQGLPAAFQSAGQALMAGDIGGAVSDIATGVGNLFVTGVDVSSTGDPLIPPGLTATVTPAGSVGALLPILTIPGMMAQNFTNLLPAGSIPAQIAQNFTNVVNTVTNTSITADALISIRLLPPSVNVSLAATFGLPLTLLVDALGAPVNTLIAIDSSFTSVSDAVGTGDWAGAAGAIIDAPAVIADGFLNGTTTLPIGFDISGYPTVINLPLSGILVPNTGYTASLSGLPIVGTLTVPVAGTPLSGLVTGLYNAAQLLATQIA